MRMVIAGLAGCACVVIAAAGVGVEKRRVDAQRPDLRQTVRVASSGELIALSSDSGDGRQQVTVIDSKSRVMSVYHIEHATGAISLKSVRNIQADLLMDEFNTESPLPREIRAILDQR